MTNKVEERQREYPNTEQAEWIKGSGSYEYCIPAPEQIIAYIEGMRISGTFKKKKNRDSQSDDVYTPPVPLTAKKEKELHAFLDIVRQRVEKELSTRAWKSGKSFADEELAQFVVVEEQVDDPSVDIATDDVSQWTSDHLYSAILDADSESDMSRLREIILVAEDAGFTVAQSEQLAPRLLDFAKRYRDSSDPQDEAAVWSAIRTGASMLTPHDVDNLRPLLEPGHSIETSLVTVKMLGRIFEAQPPVEVDEHQILADEVLQIAKSLLNQYAITSSQSAAMAQLAIYALAAMASSEMPRIVETIQQLGVPWFTRRTLRKLRGLRDIWASRPAPVAERPRELLTKALQTLERD